MCKHTHIYTPEIPEVVLVSSVIAEETMAWMDSLISLSKDRFVLFGSFPGFDVNV